MENQEDFIKIYERMTRLRIQRKRKDIRLKVGIKCPWHFHSCNKGDAA